MQVITGNEAHASETTNVDQAHLADLAQHNPEQLNSKPVQAGAYIHFVNNGFQYNFTSNGTNWSWNYAQVGSTTQSSADYTESYSQESSNQSVSSNQQSSTSVKAVSAPTTSTHNYSTSTTSYSAPPSSASTGGSTKAQFLAAGGTEELWNAIVMPESGGNVNASNGQYHGLGQTNQSWGYGSVSNQTKGMISYAKERYGSIGNAISFRQANGWW